MPKRTSAHTSPPNLGGIAVTVRAVCELKLNPQNPRKHSARQIRQLADSSRVFGFNVPILIDKDDKVLAGHGRLRAARRLGLATVPTICLPHLSEAQAHAFTIADNRLTENSSWDDRLLAQQLKGLSLLELDFSLEVTGFEIGDIDMRIASIEPKPTLADPVDLDIELPTGPPVSKPGDMWVLGDHRIVCASVLNVAAI